MGKKNSVTINNWYKIKKTMIHENERKIKKIRKEAR